MTVNDPTDPETGNADDRHHVLARKNRGIRFSDSEWDEVRKAAQDQGITPAEFVREKILHLVRSPKAALPLAPATAGFVSRILKPARHRKGSQTWTRAAFPRPPGTTAPGIGPAPDMA